MPQVPGKRIEQQLVAGLQLLRRQGLHVHGALLQPGRVAEAVQALSEAGVLQQACWLSSVLAGGAWPQAVPHSRGCTCSAWELEAVLSARRDSTLAARLAFGMHRPAWPLAGSCASSMLLTVR